MKKLSDRHNLQFIKKEKEEGRRKNLKSFQLLKCELSIVVRQGGLFS